jgi:hypothetical protein
LSGGGRCDKPPSSQTLVIGNREKSSSSDGDSGSELSSSSSSFVSLSSGGSGVQKLLSSSQLVAEGIQSSKVSIRSLLARVYSKVAKVVAPETTADIKKTPLKSILCRLYSKISDKFDVPQKTTKQFLTNLYSKLASSKPDSEQEPTVLPSLSYQVTMRRALKLCAARLAGDPATEAREETGSGEGEATVMEDEGCVREDDNSVYQLPFVRSLLVRAHMKLNEL